MRCVNVYNQEYRYYTSGFDCPLVPITSGCLNIRFLGYAEYRYTSPDHVSLRGMG